MSVAKEQLIFMHIRTLSVFIKMEILEESLFFLFFFLKNYHCYLLDMPKFRCTMHVDV